MDGLFIRKMEMDLEDDVNEVLKLERVISYYICLCGKFNFDIIVYKNVNKNVNKNMFIYRLSE